MKRYALKNTRTNQYCTYYMKSYEDCGDLVCAVSYHDDDVWLLGTPTLMQRILDGESIDSYFMDVDKCIYQNIADLVIVEIDFP